MKLNSGPLQGLFLPQQLDSSTNSNLRGVDSKYWKKACGDCHSSASLQQPLYLLG